MKHLYDGVRMGQESFLWRPEMGNEADCVQDQGAEVVPRKNFERNGVLECAKAEISRAIAPQNELYEAVAKPANAVVENQ